MPHCMNIPSFIGFVDGHLCCFHILATAHVVAINILEYKSFGTSAFISTAWSLRTLVLNLGPSIWNDKHSHKLNQSIRLLKYVISPEVRERRYTIYRPKGMVAEKDRAKGALISPKRRPDRARPRHMSQSIRSFFRHLQSTDSSASMLPDGWGFHSVSECSFQRKEERLNHSGPLSASLH